MDFDAQTHPESESTVQCNVSRNPQNMEHCCVQILNEHGEPMLRQLSAVRHTFDEISHVALDAGPVMA